MKTCQRIILRIGIYLLSLELFLRLGGYLFIQQQKYSNQEMHVNKTGLETTVLCLGESTTALGRENSYPSQLSEFLNRGEGLKPFRVVNKGRPSVTTDYFVAHVDEEIESVNPDIVILMLGINDKKYMHFDAQSFIERMIKSLERMRVGKLFVDVVRKVLHPHVENGEFSDERPVAVRGEYDAVPPEYDTSDDAEMLMKRINKVNFVGSYLGKLQQETHIAAQKGDMQSQAKTLALIDKLKEEIQKQSLEIARGFKLRSQYHEAVKYLQIVVQFFPQDAANYFEMAYCFRNLKQYPLAENFLLKYLQMEENPQGYIELSQVYMESGKTDKALSLLNYLIRKHPEIGYYHLITIGDIFVQAEQWNSAEVIYKRARNLKEESYQVYPKMRRIYLQTKRWKEGIEFFEHAVSEAIEGKWIILGDLYNDLAAIYQASGNSSLYKKYSGLADKNIHHGFMNITFDNYNKIIEKIGPQVKMIIVMQYPLRSIDPLISRIKKDSRIIFVENKENFLEAVEKEGYKSLFKDSFADDFGHCTMRGNRLIAQKLTDIIIKNTQE